MAKSFCLECSPTHQLNHASARFSSMVADYLERASDAIIPKRLSRLAERIVIGSLLKGMIASGIMRPKPINAQTHIHQRSKVVAEEAARRGWTMHVLQLGQMPTNFFTLAHPGGKMLFEGLPGVDPINSQSMVDDKEWTRALMDRLHVPTPQGNSFTKTEEAVAYGMSIGFPLVVKPRFGSLSAHTTVSIQSEKELRRAIAVAQEICLPFIVERYVPGALYRATMVGNNVIAIGRRDPPSIVGDGISTVAELVAKREQEQQTLMISLGYKPEEIPSLPTHHMKAKPTDVLPAGERMAVTWKINLSYGATVEDVTDTAHPDNIALFETIARETQRAVLGIDFLAPSIATSYREQTCAVIELNSLPSIDLHHPPIVIGTPRNVAGALLDFVTKTVST